MGQCQPKHDLQRINVLHINSNQIVSDAQMEVDVYKYPKHQFDLRQNKQIIESNPFRKRRYLRFNVDEIQYVQLSYPVFRYLSEPLQAQLGNFEIVQVFMDQINMNKALYLIKRNQKLYSLCLRTFNSYQDQIFYQIANEVYTTKRITLLNSPYLHKISNSYIIQPSAEPICSHVQLIFMEPVSTSLSFIIKNRRSKEILWTLRQLLDLMKDLVQAVSVLHKSWISHNDIRPSNIYYSQQSNNYILSSFSSVKSLTQGIPTSRSKNSMIFPEINSPESQLKRNLLSQKHKDLLSIDVFALGMTLLSAFYLCEPIDRKKSAPFSRQLAQQYPLLQIIKGMITIQDKRPSISQVKSKLYQYQKSLERTQCLTKMVYPELFEITSFDRYKRQIYIAEGYKTLGIIKSWKQKLNDRHLHEKIAQRSLESAKYFSQLAIISSIEGNLGKWKSYFIHSAEIYHQLGTKNFKQRDYHKALSYFQNSVDCLNKIKLQESSIMHIRMSLSLKQAETISGLALISHSQFQRLKKRFFLLKNISLATEFNCIQQFISIYEYFQNFQQIDELLQYLMNKLGQSCSPSDYLRIQKQIIQNNLKLIVLKRTISSQESQSLVDSTQQIINKLIDQFEYYLIQNPLNKMQIHFLHVKLNHLKQHHLGEPKLEQIESQIVDWTNHFSKLNLDQISSHFRFLHGEVVQFMADKIEDQSQHQSILSLYSLAFREYRIHFGTYYNIQCALLAEKIANLYQKNNKKDEEQQSAQIALKILNQTYGPFHKHRIRMIAQKATKRKSQRRGSRHQSHFKFQEIHFTSFIEQNSKPQQQ